MSARILPPAHPDTPAPRALPPGSPLDPAPRRFWRIDCPVMSTSWGVWEAPDALGALHALYREAGADWPGADVAAVNWLVEEVHAPAGENA